MPRLAPAPARRALALLALAVPLALLPALPTSAPAQAAPKVKVKVNPRVRVTMDDDGAGDGVARIDTTLALDARGYVDLELLGGEVVVRAWDRAEVKILATAEDGRIALSASPTRVGLELDRPGSDVRYEVTMPRTARLAVSGTNVEIDIAGVRGGIDIENANGDVSLADVAGTVRAELMTGELRVSRADGDLAFELASGDVELADVAGRVTVETVSGDIDVRGGRARELRLETTSGSLTYEGTVAADGRYELSTHSGDVVLRLPEGTSARVAAETYSGEFRSDFPVVMQPNSGAGARQRRFELQLGGGTGPLIRVESFNGDIHLARAGAR